MTEQNKAQSGMIDRLLNDLPSPLRFILLLSLLVPLNLAITGMLLNVNVGKLLEEALDRHYAQQEFLVKSQTDVLLEQIAQRVNETANRIGNIEARQYSNEVLLQSVVDWACGPIRKDGNANNDPEFCDGDR